MIFRSPSARTNSLDIFIQHLYQFRSWYNHFVGSKAHRLCIPFDLSHFDMFHIKNKVAFKGLTMQDYSFDCSTDCRHVDISSVFRKKCYFKIFVYFMRVLFYRIFTTCFEISIFILSNCIRHPVYHNMRWQYSMTGKVEPYSRKRHDIHISGFGKEQSFASPLSFAADHVITASPLDRFPWVKRTQTIALRPNERDGVSNQQPHDCLLKRLFRRRSPGFVCVCVCVCGGGGGGGGFIGDRWIRRIKGQ